MRIIKEFLEKRKNNPVKVAIIGCGWFGSGMVRELYRWPGMQPKLIITRTKEKALKTLEYLGNPDIEVTDSLDALNNLKDIDVVFEATGDVNIGAVCASRVLEQRIPYVTTNIEMDATIGFAINRIAEENDSVYSICDGDQPGVLARMIDEVTLYGFEIIVAGNCKSFMDVHQNPGDVMPWVQVGHNPRMITAFADGTKQGLEMTSLANGTGLVPDIQGMHGPKTTKERIVEDFLKIIKQDGVVDYAFGINENEAGGIFVIGRRKDLYATIDFSYLKKGTGLNVIRTDGSYHLFFRPYHLCYFEAAKSIVEALFKIPILLHKKRVADVFAVAKRDMRKGEKLDGIGGFTVYGLIDKAEYIKEKRLLPVGLTSYARLKQDVPHDTPISYDMVETEDNLAVRLRNST